MTRCEETRLPNLNVAVRHTCVLPMQDNATPHSLTAHPALKYLTIELAFACDVRTTFPYQYLQINNKKTKIVTIISRNSAFKIS